MTRDEAKKKLWKTRNINTQSKVECYAIIDELCNTHEAEKQEMLNILKKFDEMAPIEKDKAFNELIDILEETKWK